MMRKFNILGFALICLFTAGCNKKASDEIDFGTIENSVYRNDYFGFEITLPQDWHWQDVEAQKELLKAGSELVAGNDESLKAVMEASELQSVTFFSVFKFPLGAPVASNPGIISVAERVRQLPGIQRGSDYHFHSKKLLESSAMDVSFPQEIYEAEVGGLSFDVMSLEMKMGGTVILQDQYCTIMKGYAFLILISYGDEAEKAELIKVLDTARFE